MGGKTKEAAQLTRYLLGGGSETERERYEAEFFADDEAFQEMLTAEDDLFDAYARGELSTNERLQFEKRFLTSSDGRERVQFARAFAASRPVVTPTVKGTTTPGFFASILGPTMAFRTAMATVAIAAVVGFPWLLVERSRMNEELHELRAERETLNQRAAELQRIADDERARSTETTAQLDKLTKQIPSGQQGDNGKDPQPVKSLPDPQITKNRSVEPDDGTIANDRRDQSASPASVEFDLNPGTVRGGSGNTLQVPRNAGSIRLRLTVETRALPENYSAVIETPEGRTVKRLNSIKTLRNSGNASDYSTQLVTVPAKDLPPGDYILFLSEKRANGIFENFASYSFRVVRK